jgi:hypothetical protein
MGGDEPLIRFRADEPELYLAFNHEFVKLIAGGHRGRVLVRVDPVLPLPAGSRPQLEGLYRTAQRETWRLNAQRFAN